MCEYKPSSRCVRSASPPRQAASILLTSAIPRRPSAVAIPQRPTFAVAVFPPTLPGDEGFGNVLAQQTPIPQHSPLASSPWSHRGSEDMGDSFTHWPGFDVVGQSSTPASTGQYAWSTEPSNISMCILPCEDGCTSHSDEVHGAIRALRAHRPTPSQWASGNWSSGGQAWTLAPAMLPDAGNIAWPFASHTPELAHLPVAQPMQNSELLSICMYPAGLFPARLLYT